MPNPCLRFLSRHLRPMRWPATHWGFPVASEQGGSAAAGSSGTDGAAGGAVATVTPAAGERGIALLIAIMIISIMMLFTSDLILSSQVNIALATTARDNLKAEYMAKSGLNIASFMVSSDLAFEVIQFEMNEKAGFKTSQSGIWAALNGWPIGGETMDMLDQFREGAGLNAVMDSGVMDQLKLFDGAFTVDVADEGQKINVNDCYNGRCTEVLLMLEGLFSCPAEKAFLEQKKVSGRELAYRIKDYIDKDTRAEEASGFNDENEPYTKRIPKQMAKNAPLDSVNELRTIEGWDDDIHAVFSPFLTVYPLQKNSTDKTFRMNINTAARALLQCLFPESRGDCNEKVALAFKRLEEEPGPVGKSGQKMSDVLRETLCYSGGDGNPGEANNRANWFTDFSMVFRIKSMGNVGNSSREAAMVVERFMPDMAKGEKSSFRTLYYHLQ